MESVGNEPSDSLLPPTSESNHESTPNLATRQQTDNCRTAWKEIWILDVADQPESAKIKT